MLLNVNDFLEIKYWMLLGNIKLVVVRGNKIVVIYIEFSSL